MTRASTAFERLRGPVVPLNVCFNDDGTVDYASVCNYVDWLCTQKAPVIVGMAESWGTAYDPKRTFETWLRYTIAKLWDFACPTTIYVLPH